MEQGRSPQGEACVIEEWSINGKLISAVAAYSSVGFLCWRIHYKDAVTHRSVDQFLNHDLKPFFDLCSDKICLADNASIHHTIDITHRLRIITNGKYKYISTYSPDFNPIERGFSNVWQYVRGMSEDIVSRDPIAAINEAFQYYSLYGPGGSAGMIIYIYMIYIVTIITCFAMCIYLFFSTRALQSVQA